MAQKQLTPKEWIQGLLGLVILAGIGWGAWSIWGADATSPAKSVASSPPAAAPKAAPEPVAARPPMPPTQQAFIQAVEQYRQQFHAAEGDLRKSVTRTDRGKSLSSALAATNGQIKGWVGTIGTLKTTEDGRAYISISVAKDVTLMTFNNGFSDTVHKTLVVQTSPLFGQMMDLKVGDVVVFDASLWRDPKDGWKELSMTERGAMTDPSFLMSLQSIRRAP